MSPWWQAAATVWGLIPIYVAVVWTVRTEMGAMRRRTAARLTLAAPVWPLALLVLAIITLARWAQEDA